MKYRKTFTEAVREVWAKAAKKKEEEKPVADEKPVEKPAEDKGGDKEATIEKLKLQVGLLKQKLENQKNKVVQPIPNKDTGEVPLRTGIAQALLDKDGKNGKVIAKKEKKEKVSVGKGQTKVEVDPDVEMGIHSGGATVDTGNLH